MSISSITQNPYFIQHAIFGQTGAASGSAAAGATATSTASSASSSAASGTTALFQQLTSALQAFLTQLQASSGVNATTSSSATGTSASAGTASGAASSSGASSSPNGSATALTSGDSASGTGQTESHHHHHHHDHTADQASSGANDLYSAAAAFPSALATGSSTNGAPSSAQSSSTIPQASISAAFAAYASSGAGTQPANQLGWF